MLKRTKMIVITKKMLIAFTIGFLLVSTGITVLITTVRHSSINAFAEYKPIIDSQFATDKEDKIEKKNKAELILKSFFAFSDKKTETKEEAQNEQPQETPELITSDVRKIEKGLSVTNATEIPVNPTDFLNQKLSFCIDGNGPQVLVMHTHTTESYSEEQYPKDSPDRDLDEAKNIVAVGEAITEVFIKNGIQAYHDRTVHDYPSYNGAYQRAATTIRNDLEAYGGIKVVLDVHRDGITKEDGTKVKLLADINGKPTAQVMLVVGTNTNLEHENWQENFKFASKIQAKAIEMYPGLMRPINIRKERFNEQLTNGSLIIEIGTNGNTLPEAVEAGKDIADVIKEVLKEEN